MRFLSPACRSLQAWASRSLSSLVRGLSIALFVGGLVGYPAGGIAEAGWQLVLAPLDVVQDVAARTVSAEETMTELLERAPLSDWVAAKEFSTSEACESEKRARAAATGQALADLVRQGNDARRRGDGRMAEILETMVAHRTRDAAALCVVRNDPRPSPR